MENTAFAISNEQLSIVKKWVFSILDNESSGHDTFHIKRVVELSKRIANNEICNTYLTELIALIHDMIDYKLFDDVSIAEKALINKLKQVGLSNSVISLIIDEVNAIGYKNSGKTTPKTLEAKIVQDADRLDAIGAIGIARAFAYGGKKGNLIYDPTNKNLNSLQHFDDKLIHLKSLMNTKTGKELAQERTQYLINFKERFLEEWYL